MLPTLYCLADSHEHAERLVTQLQSAGVSQEHLSALILSEDPKNRPVPLAGFEYAGTAPQSETEKTAAGVTTGAAGGALAGVATMGIVGLTPLLIVAPLVVTGGAVAGATAGGLAGAQGNSLADFGVPEEQREAFQKKLTDGGVLVAVRSDDEEELEKANVALEQGGAKDIGLFRLTKRLA